MSFPKSQKPGLGKLSRNFWAVGIFLGLTLVFMMLRHLQQRKLAIRREIIEEIWRRLILPIRKKNRTIIMFRFEGKEVVSSGVKSSNAILEA